MRNSRRHPKRMIILSGVLGLGLAGFASAMSGSLGGSTEVVGRSLAVEQYNTTVEQYNT